MCILLYAVWLFGFILSSAVLCIFWGGGWGGGGGVGDRTTMIFIFLSFLLILKLVGIHEHIQFPFFCISNSFFSSNIFLHIGQATSITAVSLTISPLSSSVEETVLSVLFCLLFFLPICINMYIFIFDILNS